MYVDTGTSWKALIAYGRATDEVPTAGWTSVNAGSGSSFTTLLGFLFGAAPSDGTINENMRCFVRTLPAKPYKVRTHIRMMPAGKSSATNAAAGAGLVLRDSVGGGLVGWQLQHNPGDTTNFPRLVAGKWTSPTVFSANYVDGHVLNQELGGGGGGIWLELADDNLGTATSRSFRFSMDGVNWFTFFQASATDFITPNQIGVCINPKINELDATFEGWEVA